MTGVVTAVVGSTVASGYVANKAAGKAADAQRDASNSGIAEQRDAREAFEQRTQPFADIGLQAREPLQELLGMGPSSQILLDERARLEGKLAGRRSNFTPVHEARLQEIDQLLESREQGLPELPQAVDLSALPQAPTAFDPTDVDNPIMDFLLEEGFRGIREGAAGGGRVPDRDLVKFAQGTAATLAPQIQAQRFGQQSALRNQALGEQGTQFAQEGGLRGVALGEKQQEIANLQNLLGLGQSTAVGQGQAALQAGSNVSNLLGNIGTSQAQAALAKGQAQQGVISGIGGAIGLGLGGGLGGRFGDVSQGRPVGNFGEAQQGPLNRLGGF